MENESGKKGESLEGIKERTEKITCKVVVWA
jgi:hypothetical protein